MDWNPFDYFKKDEASEVTLKYAIEAANHLKNASEFCLWDSTIKTLPEGLSETTVPVESEE